MKRAIFGAVVASSLLSVSAYAETISISCGAVGQELELCQEGVSAWEKETGHTVKIVTTPNSTTERLALYQQLLAAGAKDIDVFQIDVIWPGILGNHFIDLKQYSNGDEEAHFPSIVANNTVKGRLVAMPWFTDAGVLYYRTDLLEKYGEQPPTTWEQLTATAEKVQKGEREAGNDKMWGFVWQGRAYEGLTCDALEWVASYNGGTIVDEEGKVTINNDNAKQALTTAAGWVDTISPPGVLNYGEEEARGVFQTGNAVFMRNWPYAWSLGNSDDSPVKGKIGVVALPKGGEEGRHAGTLGGWQLSVSKYSESPEVAASLVMFLTSFNEQKRRAIKGSYNPTIETLYQDEEVLAAAPFFGSLYNTFANGTPRPSTQTGAKYNQVSNAFWNATHSVLSGNKDADAALTKLNKDLKRISRNGRW
ncbi:Maltose/maltodextrin ABC transporter, substrate binding periplasmic protein MalE [Grimontia indica]|uniref:Maltose/maltodextrin ABC transporter, substrate binding periplasmic protein MalE n=1 Tax=Grimontia indica TaxID=1056512 RepID=R1GLT1_9GAMM|nr:MULTISPECIES: ABC transporter substrate-binding protein [Grimontia]EOD77123.1 Maltose/maltodextrin ABC transporter, substrate binding periplasmic protein MalE [Grimontia indica]